MIRAILTSGSMRSLRHKPDRSCATKPGHISCHRQPSGNTWTPDEIKQMLARKQLFRAHAFELACTQNDVAHRLTKPRHPWTNGQVERMNRAIKEATVQRFYYATHEQLRTHLAD